MVSVHHIWPLYKSRQRVASLPDGEVEIWLSYLDNGDSLCHLCVHQVNSQQWPAPVLIDCHCVVTHLMGTVELSPSPPCCCSGANLRCCFLLSIPFSQYNKAKTPAIWLT